MKKKMEKTINLLLLLIPACLCLAPYFEHENWVVFTRVGKENEIYIDVEKNIDILFLNKLSITEYLYKLEITTQSSKQLTVRAFHGESTSPLFTDVVKIEGKHPLKMSWQSGVVHLTRNGAYVSMLNGDLKMFNVAHIAVQATPFASVIFKDTYNFIANVDQVCAHNQRTYPFLVCDMDILPEKSIPTSTSEVLVPVMSNKMYKTSNVAEPYEIKIVLNTTDKDPYTKDVNQQYKSRNPLFYIVKNNRVQLKSSAHSFVGKPITLGVNFGKQYTFVGNDNIDQAVQWHEQETGYNFENINKLIIQNYKTLVSQNTCQFQCVNKNKRGFFARIATLAKSYFSLEEYCRATELDRVQ